MSTNTELAERLRQTAPFIAVGDDLLAAAAALEAAEAELTRRDSYPALRESMKHAVADVLEDRLEDDIHLDLNVQPDTDRFWAMVNSVTDAVLVPAERLLSYRTYVKNDYRAKLAEASRRIKALEAQAKAAGQDPADAPLWRRVAEQRKALAGLNTAVRIRDNQLALHGRCSAGFGDSLPNDGEYEYTSTSDCDGSNPTFYRRLPARHADAAAWERITAEEHLDASRNWRGDWRPVSTEGTTR